MKDPFGESPEGGPVTKPVTDGWFDPDLDQDAFDLDFFGRVLLRNANHVDALRQQVELLARIGDHERALELDRRLVTLAPCDVIARYNLACSLSMVGDVEGAVVALDMALEMGYCDWAHLESDADLQAVRDHQAFDELLRKYGLA